MNDEQRLEDERIARAAREVYNVPPATPRDEMWSDIEARLDAGAADSSIAEIGERARIAGRLSWWMGVAAALVIGLGLGRLSLGTGEGEPAVAARSETEAPDIAEPATAESALAAVPEDRDSVDVDRPAGETGRPAENPSPEATRAAPPDGFDPGASRAPYMTATREHLDRSESFLAGVRVDLTAGTADTDFESWARSLLSRTRLLLASPAGRDPETRRLLEDLELMLAQVVVTAGTGDPAEVRLLGEGLQDGNLLRRLRSATSEQTGPGDARTPRTSSL